MIRYTLLCANEHGFDSWFRDSEAYEQLSAQGQVSCPMCGSTAVRKALMMPSVVTRKANPKPVDRPTETVPTPAPAAAPSPQPVALLDDKAQQLRAMMREMHRRVTASADDVGRSFASEARAIHEGDAPARSIYGEATREEVTSLLDDGIPLLPMPVLPDDQH